MVTIKGRVAPKHDIEANWLKATNFIPANSEIIVYNKEKDGDLLPDGRTIKIEYDRIKIGDGITNVKDLPFLITETEGVGRKTEEGGLIFNDYENNLALGKNCVAMGTDCAAGTRGYYYQSIDIVNKKIYLTTELVERTIEVLDKTEREMYEESGFDYLPYQEYLKDDGTYGLYTVEFSKTRPGQKYNVYKQDGTYVGYFTFSEPRYDDNECGDVLDVITDVSYLAGYSMPGGPANFSQCGYGEFYDFRAVLSSTTTSGPIISTEDFTDTSFETPAYEVGDKFNIINFQHYVLCGEIIAIEHNVISYKDELPFTEIQEDIDEDAYTIWVSAKPEVGIALPFEDSFSVGLSNNVASGWSFAAGYNNTIASNFGSAVGRDNIVGYGAMAIGVSNKALGYRSLTAGYENEANGRQGIALGYRNKSNGYNSFTAGSYNEANAENAFAAGFKTISSGLHSVSFGNTTTASGEHSFVFGANNTASGKGAFAGGYRNKATGDYSFAFGGEYAEATGLHSIAIGREAKSYGNSSIAIGRNCMSSKYCSVALGQGATSSADYAVAIGYGAQAYGLGSVALGGYNYTTGKYAIAGGDHCSSHSQGSTALGHYATASGTGSLSAGVFTESTIAGQTVVGKYNATNSKAFFIVGNGKSVNDRKNAFEVMDNGTANLQKQGTTDNSVVIYSTIKNGLTLTDQATNTKYKLYVANGKLTLEEVEA